MGNEPTSDLEVERQIFRECQGALEALAAAFGRSADRPGGLSPDELWQLRGLTVRTFQLVTAVGFPDSSLEALDGR